MSDYRLQEIQRRFGIIGESDKIKEIIETIVQVAPTDITVLINGESGTGKELIADALYNYSLRKHNKFIKVNCGAIPAGILESELFGHVKGSFTGAIEDRKGYFETADGGTIFLDEIGEMPLETQVKFLRVLESGEFLPVGGSKSRKVDVRIIAATNKKLGKEIEKDRFRKDLYYRLKTITLTSPALREHPEDLPLLVKKFALDFANRNQIAFKGFSPEAMEIMKNYSWPGNIRELKNFVESVIVLQKGEVISSHHVHKQLGLDEMPVSNFSPNLPVKISKTVEQAERELILKQLFLLRKDVNDIKEFILQDKNMDFLQLSHSSDIDYPTAYHQPAKPVFHREIPKEEDFQEQEDESLINMSKIGEMSMADMERTLIEETLKKFGFKKRKTAQALEISERTLYRKIKEYGLKE
ncbi:MAG: sigma-54-dependent Fis family transcriptional regulator [Candidatus Marinimicrobia bacterium]|nr:sigma-54-dependent Fis family transcriptional regulator [Candidatus Neomarinimicrobiota bacterium]